MEITFDPEKNERNIRDRGLSFALAAEFDFEGAVTHVEQRRGENRLVSVGYLGNRLHVLCYLETASGVRVISFRKANQREAMKYGLPKTLDR
ncbi:MAG: BrnT family toxin [Acidobacteriaceae bacterium]